MKFDKSSHILVIERETPTRLPLVEQYAQVFATISAIYVRNLAEARDSLTNTPTNLILCDLELDDGRAVELLGDAPLVLLVDDNGERDALKALDEGCVDFIVRSDIREENVTRILARALRQCDLVKKHKEAQFAKRELFASQAHLDAIIQSEPECVKTVAHDGTLLEMNPAGLAIIEADRLEDVQGECVYDLIAPHHRDKFIELNRQVFAGNRVSLEFEVLTLKGNYRWVDSTATPLYDEQGNVKSQLAVTRDITERKEAEKRLKTLYNELEHRVKLRTRELSEVNETLVQANLAVEKANEAKADFLASMSHEIRTPMNGILGLVELLEHSNLDEKQQQYIRTIQRSSNTLITVINDILDYSKIEAGKMELEHFPFDLAELIHDIVAPYEIKSDSNLQLQVTLDSKLPPYLIGDTVRLHQILANLLNNAFKFTHEGYVSLEVSFVSLCSDGADQDRVDIDFVVRDTGVGISEQAQKYLFQPFTQADQSTTRMYGGTGLGLAICKRLVETMRGDITVTSELGKGSSFTSRIPFEVEGKSTLQPIPASEIVNFEQLNVLLVEDNPVNQLVCKELMSKLGVQVSLASSGVEAVDMVCRATNTFDLVMMDCEMPGMDGYSATRKIRSWEQSSNRPPTPIHACTAHVLSTSIKKCSDAGMDDHISKPINLEKLIKTFEKIKHQH
jgi:two-component system, sensor histidine kinase